MLQELISIYSLFRCLEMAEPPWALGWPSTVAAMLPFRCLAIKVSGIEDIYINMFWCFGRHPRSQGTIPLYGDQNWLNILFCVKPFFIQYSKNCMICILFAIVIGGSLAAASVRISAGPPHHHQHNHTIHTKSCKNTTNTISGGVPFLFRQNLSQPGGWGSDRIPSFFASKIFETKFGFVNIFSL